MKASNGPDVCEWVLAFDKALVIEKRLGAAHAFSFGLNQICERRRSACEHAPGLICRIPHVSVIGTGTPSHELSIRPAVS